jgi:isopentenyl-diphosphate delta-isomerase
MPGEDIQEAAVRRLREELGFTTTLHKAFSFTYRAMFDNGLSENEYDHVFIGHYDGPISPNKEEVSDYTYKNVEEIRSSMDSHPHKYTEWFKIALPRLHEYLLINPIRKGMTITA